MMSKMRKLLISQPYIEGESLFGYLNRLSHENLLPSTSILYQNLGLVSKGALAKLFDASSKQAAISHAIGLPAELLERLLPRKLDEDPGTFAINGLELREHHYVRNARRVSPRSLQISPHLRSSWHLSDLNFCRETWDVLIDTCQAEHCGAKLTLDQKMAVHQCDRCGFDLRLAATDTILIEDRPTLQFVADLASHDEVEVLRAMNNLHPSLRHNNRGTLLQLVSLFGRAKAAGSGQTNMRKHRNEASYPSLAVAGGRILRNFPTSILEIAEQEHEQTSPDFFKRLQILALTGLTKAAQVAVKTLVTELRPIAKASVRGLSLVRREHGALTIRQAASLLGVDNAATRRLVKIGALDSVHIRGSQRKNDWFDPAKVDALAKELSDRISADAIHSEFGLPLTAIEQLVEIGALRWHPSEAVRTCFSGHFLIASDFRAFISQVKASLRYVDKESNARISLAECFALVRSAPKPWGPVLARAASGKLLGGLEQISSKHGFKASNLTIAPEIAVQIMTRTLDWKPLTEPQRQECDYAEAEERLACNPADISVLLRAGIIRRLKPKASKFCRQSVLEAANTYISTREIAARLGMQVQSVSSWARRWGLEKPSGFTLWLRDEVEHFLPEGGHAGNMPPKEAPQQLILFASTG
jgi:hypothetical protein